MPRKSVALAKLSRPRLCGVYARERLYRLLDHRRERPILWLGAQPGAGKTTLVASYLDSKKVLGLWYQLDSSDAHPATFFYYLGLAERALQGARKRPSLPLLTAEYLPDLAGFTRRYFRELYSRLGQRSVLVFDNFQEVPEDAAFHQVFAQALSEIPAGINVIVLSRLEPPAAYNRFVANRELGLLDWDEMRLTLDETKRIAGTHREVDSQTLESLHDRSGGWAAGLTLLLERLRRGESIEAISEPGALDGVFNYFAGQIFDTASAENQHILLHLGFLPRMTADLAQELCSSEHAGKLLDYLYRRHLFTDRRKTVSTPSRFRNDKRGARTPSRPSTGEALASYTYQFHALFRAFLQHRAREAYSADKLADIRRRAAQLLEANSDFEEAFDLCVEAQDWAAAANLARREAAALIRQGRWKVVVAWIERLPKHLVATDAHLMYWFGLAQMPESSSAARETLERAFRLAENTKDALCQIEAAAGIVETIFLEYTHFAPLDRWIGVLEQAFSQRISFPGPDAELRAYTASLSAILYRQGNKPALRQYVARTFELLESDADINLKVAAGTQLLSYGTNLGHMDITLRALPLIEPLLTHPDVTPLRQGLCGLFVAWAYVNRPDEERARAAIARLDQIAETHSLAKLKVFSAVTGYWAEMGHLRLERAEKWMAVLAEAMNPSHFYDVASINVGRAWTALVKGDAHRALQHAREAVRVYELVGSAWHRILGRGLLIWTYVQLDNHREARKSIEEARALSRSFGINLYDPHRWQAEAWMARKEGDEASYRRHLEALFTAAEESGYGYPFRFFPTWMPQLCAHALSYAVKVDFVRRLIRQWRWPPPSPNVEQWPWQIKIRTLGGFEILLDDRAPELARKPPARLLSLLKAIVAFGGTEVPEQKLIDAIWPDEEGDAGVCALHVALSRLRKLLGSTNAIQISDGKVSLDLKRCWIDAFAFEQMTVTLPRACESTLAAQALRALERACELYRGGFLAGDADTPWIIPIRERLRNKFVAVIEFLALHLEANQDWDRAAQLYRRGIEADELFERFHQGLIRCYLNAGRPAEALSAYRRLRQTLSVILGISPSAQTEALYRSIHRQADWVTSKQPGSFPRVASR